MKIDPQWRRYFDQQLEQVLPQLPQRVHELLEEIPLIVEDYPGPRIMQKMGIRRRGALCGLYSGIPLGQKSVELSGQLSDAIYLYREGIFNMAIDDAGAVDEQELREQIRITILHELGHYHGLDEDDLAELGYD